MANKIKSFLYSVRAELKKVSWPTRGEVVRSTIISLAAIILFSIVIGGIDLLFLQMWRIFLG